MSSIIKNKESLEITYTTSSMTRQTGSTDNVLIDDDNSYFLSSSQPSQQWWQISFSKIVEINSYTIRTKPSMGARPMSWEALASMDDVNWEVVSVVSKDAGGNTEVFPTSYKVNCKHFRIVQKQNSNKDSNYYLKFTFFDCFGKLGKNVSRRVQCFQNTIYRTKGVSYSTLLYILVLIK